jgi:hypothetical protein
MQTLKIGNAKITAEHVGIKEVRWEEMPTEGVILFFATVQTRTSVLRNSGMLEFVTNDEEVRISQNEFEKYRELIMENKL